MTLRDVLGLSYREIADLQQAPEGTVKSRIHEGRRRLRDHLAGDRTTTVAVALGG